MVLAQEMKEVEQKIEIPKQYAGDVGQRFENSVAVGSGVPATRSHERLNKIEFDMKKGGRDVQRVEELCGQVAEELLGCWSVSGSGSWCRPHCAAKKQWGGRQVGKLSTCGRLRATGVRTCGVLASPAPCEDRELSEAGILLGWGPSVNLPGPVLS